MKRQLFGHLFRYLISLIDQSGAIVISFVYPLHCTRFFWNFSDRFGFAQIGAAERGWIDQFGYSAAHAFHMKPQNDDATTSSIRLKQTRESDRSGSDRIDLSKQFFGSIRIDPGSILNLDRSIQKRSIRDRSDPILTRSEIDPIQKRSIRDRSKFRIDPNRIDRSKKDRSWIDPNSGSIRKKGSIRDRSGSILTRSDPIRSDSQVCSKLSLNSLVKDPPKGNAV